ncbi:MAG: MBL fold metallo-hydrolase [bacterium]|nr:MBL fold metallo-hydrolase [bacterium]
MQLDILGSSGTYPAPDRPASGYLISNLSTHILCDVGFGVFAELLRRMPPDRLDAVVLSHRHPDHCADFLALHHALAYGPFAVTNLPVYAAPGVADRIAEFLGAGEGHVLFRTFDFHEVGEDNHVIVGSIDLRFAVTAHSVPTVATRFEAGGRSLVYSADTGPGGGFPALCRRASVVMAEASIPGERDHHEFAHHLTAAEAGEIARAGEAEMLILTHLRPSLDKQRAGEDAVKAFGGRVAVASPGDVFQI